ncbi:MAG: CRISPR-associated endonuclease Cas1 [Gammaproteobacteria bacterium]
MSTLYLDRKDLTLKADGQALALYENGERRGTVPLHLLGRVVVRGHVELDSRVLGALNEHGIDAMFLSGRGSRLQAVSLGRSHNDVRRRLAQYRSFFDHEHRSQLALQLVRAKLKNQYQVLGEALPERPDCRKPLFSAMETLSAILEKLDEATSAAPALEQLRGYEGAGAAVYFDAFTRLFAPSLGFDKRTKRPPTDPVNACLSLGYTLLHFEAVSVCRQVGLEPLLGFYHEPAFGRESLACDLIETVRPRMDRWLWELFRKRQLTKEHCSMDKGACLLNKDGRKVFFAGYEVFVRPVRRLLRLYGQRLAKDYLERDWLRPL